MLSMFKRRAEASRRLDQTKEHARNTASNVAGAVAKEMTALRASSGQQGNNKRHPARSQPSLEWKRYCLAVEYIWAINPPYLSDPARLIVLSKLKQPRDTYVFDQHTVRTTIDRHPALKSWYALQSAHTRLKATYAADEAEQTRLPKAAALVSKIACVPGIAPLEVRKRAASARVRSAPCSFCQATAMILELKHGDLIIFRGRYPLGMQMLDVGNDKQHCKASTSKRLNSQAFPNRQRASAHAESERSTPGRSTSLPAQSTMIRWASSVDLRPPKLTARHA